MGNAIEICMPLKTVSEANTWDTWRPRHARQKAQKAMVYMYLVRSRDLIETIPRPYKITLTRIGKRILDDDNLQSSFKSARDQIADFLGVNDGDRKAVHWAYKQQVGKEYAVCVHIATRRRVSITPLSLEGGNE